MNRWRHARRTFLRDMDLGLACLPLFREELAAAAVCPRRLIIVMQSEGVIQESFWPKGGDGTDLTGMTMGEITAPLEPWKKDVTFLRGVQRRNFTDYPGHGGGHENYSMCFTGAKGAKAAYNDPRWEAWEAASPSIDHHIAKGLAGKPGVPALEALRLGVQVERQGSYQAQKRCFYRGDRQPYSPNDNPYTVFSELFAGKAGGNPALDKLRGERRSIIDFVGKDLERFAARLGKEYQSEVQAHLASVQKIGKQLAPSAGGTGGTCVASEPAKLDLAANDSYPAIMDLQFDMAVAALRCDVTRIVTIQVNNANGEKVVFSWVKGVNQTPMEYGRRDHHDLAHRPGANKRDKILVDAWYMSKLAELIKRLSSTPDCTGSLLDSTALLWANHMGDGGAHSSTSLPWILAGRAGGAFKPGRVAKIDGPTNGVLIALANAMGVPTETFGDPKYGGEAAAVRG